MKDMNTYKVIIYWQSFAQVAFIIWF